MIKNERQYLITKKQAETFRQALASAQRAPAPTTKAARDQRAWQINGLTSQLATLDEELRLYDDLQNAAGRRTLSVAIEHLAALLIQARIARGWTQRQLAERLGLQMQKVQQYEATDYAGASLGRLLEVCQALGLTGTIAATLVPLPTLKGGTQAPPAVPELLAAIDRSRDAHAGARKPARRRRAS